MVNFCQMPGHFGIIFRNGNDQGKQAKARTSNFENFAPDGKRSNGIKNSSKSFKSKFLPNEKTTENPGEMPDIFL